MRCGRSDSRAADKVGSQTARRAASAFGLSPPRVRDRLALGGVAGGGQAVDVLERAEHAVVVNGFRVAAGFDRLAGEEGGDVIVAAALVPGDDQEAVVRLGPLGVAAEVVLQPLIG